MHRCRPEFIVNPTWWWIIWKLSWGTLVIMQYCLQRKFKKTWVEWSYTAKISLANNKLVENLCAPLQPNEPNRFWLNTLTISSSKHANFSTPVCKLGGWQYIKGYHSNAVRNTMFCKQKLPIDLKQLTLRNSIQTGFLSQPAGRKDPHWWITFNTDVFPINVTIKLQLKGQLIKTLKDYIR